MLSKDFLLKTFVDLNATKINAHLIEPTSRQLHHFTPDEFQNKSRLNYILLTDAYEFISKNNDAYVIALSTTFDADNTYKAFVGLDVEYPYTLENLNILKAISKEISATMSIVRTKNGFHVFVPELYDNDFTLLNRISDFIELSAALLHHSWVCKYTTAFRKAMSFNELDNIAVDILNEVGHVERGVYTFFDL